MSDGAISQDEIEALLSGVDLSGGSMGAMGGMPSVPSADTSAIQNFINGTVGAFTSGLQTMTSSTFTVGNPMVEMTNRDMLLMKLPDMVVCVKTDFVSGLMGDHTFLFSSELTQKVASLVTSDDSAEVDEMALSVIGELASQQVGTEITALAAKFPGLSASPAQATHIPKSTVNFAQNDIILFSYPVSGDGGVFTIWEVMSQNIATEISNAFAPQSPIGGGLSADEMASLGGGVSMGGMSGGFGGGGMSIPGMNIPNVQSLQYPNLQQGMNSMEQGNISLIMDVYMEMTVELGRTKKQIKEILGMGEGTIIELDKLAGEPVDILVNHKPIAKGEVVVIDENFGVRVTEILSPIERVSDLN